MSDLVKEIKVHTPNKYKYIINDLKKMGYDDVVMVDEIIAYISTNEINEWKINKKILTKFQKTFKRYYDGRKEG